MMRFRSSSLARLIAGPPFPAAFVGLVLASVSSTLWAADPIDRSGIEASVLFERKPVERGLHFDRHRAKPSDKHGKSSWEMHAMPDAAQWLRYVSLGFSDQRFTQGKMPVVDVQIEYLLDAWGSVVVFMDTGRGSTKVAEGWGGSPEWKTLKFRVEDAYFGGRDHGGLPSEMTSSRSDIRIYAVNKAPLIRSVKVTGYDRKNVQDWRPLLKVGNALHPERETLVFHPRPGQKIRYPLSNLSLVDKEVVCRFTVSDHDGRMIAASNSTRLMRADSITLLDFDLKTEGALLGPYRTKLELSDPVDQSVLQTVESLIGVINDRDMAKARPGEFLYGIQKVKDPCKGIDREWLDIMGVDMVRGWASGPIMENTLRTCAPVLKRQGVTAIVIIDPPKPGSFTQYNPDGFPEGVRTRQVAEMASQLTPLARDLKEVVTYWEIGNEPDLKAFYSGPVEEYIESFREMRAAIKKGNPEAIVMNGGLCYFGDDGKRRAKIIVDALAPDGVDAWAYHAHGPYAASERKILELMRSQVTAHGPMSRPFFQTESGVAAKSDSQALMQAQTVIQKMVYAQSEGVRAFAWFALHMGESESEYANAINLREPRPAILAYRTMVQQLRHRQYTRTIPLDGGAEAYLFTSKDDDTGVVVIWANGPARKNSLFQVAADVAEVSLVDLFGNERNVTPFGKGMIEVSLSHAPIFVRWRSRDGFNFAEAASPLELPNPVWLAASSTTKVPLVVRNATTAEKTFEVVVETHSSTPLDIAPVEPLSLAAGTSREIPLEVHVGAHDGRLAWPIAWKVFARPDRSLERVDLTGIQSFVDTIEGVVGEWHFLENQSLNLGVIAGGHHEHDAAIILGTVYAPQDMTVEIGMAADWWMQVFLNGNEIISTMDHGNQGPGELAAHTAVVKLHRGVNLIAAKVISGSGGWRFMTGGPDELLLERNPGKPPDRFDAFVRVDGKPMGGQTSCIQFHRPVFPFRPDPARGGGDLPPETEITADRIVNFHEKHPDSSRWYGGENDLSGLVWLYKDSTHLRLIVRVRDDTLVGSQKAPLPGDHDSITVTFTSGLSDTSKHQYRVSADGETQGLGFADGAMGKADVVSGVLTYQFDWPLEWFETNLLDIRVELEDSDQGYPKQKFSLSLVRLLKE